MLRHEYIFESERRRGRKKKVTAPRDLDSTHQKNGYYDGKIFYSDDKVTYTFVSEDEVVVLHFDLNRHSLFLKGHKISSLDIRENLQEFLGQFKKCLMDNPHTQKFVKPFDAVVSSLCETN